MDRLEFTFNILVEKNGESFVAHCLEMGLVAVSNDQGELPSIMVKMVCRQLEFALRNNNPSDIYHPAPPEIWEKFRAATREHRAHELERTQKHLRLKDWPNLTIDQTSYATAC